jgi:hypothetical protein
MKLNPILTIISIIAAALFGYMFYSIPEDSDSKMLTPLAISGFVSIFSCLVCGIGLTWPDAHHKVNAFAISFFFFIIFIAEHCCFAIWGEKPAWLISTSGLVLLMYLIIIYGISNAKMKK